MRSITIILSLIAFLVSGCSNSEAELIQKEEERKFQERIENRTEENRKPGAVASAEGYTGPSDCLQHLD